MVKMAERKVVPIRKVRRWARDRGIEVGTRGHLPQELIDRFNRSHRTVRAENKNPMVDLSLFEAEAAARDSAE